MSGHTILLTRPRLESEKLAAEIRAFGLDVFIEPMLEIVPLDVSLPDLTKYQALVFTSANGIEAFSRLSRERSLPVFTVGGTTAARAREAGFRNVKAGESGDVEGLNNILGQARLVAGVPVLHVSGEYTAGTMAIDNVPVERLVAYRADTAKTLGAECLERLDRHDFAAVVFYSPRTAENFTELILTHARESKTSAIKALCISEAVVKCLRRLPWQDVQIAGTPNRGGMLQLIERLAGEAR